MDLEKEIFREEHHIISEDKSVIHQIHRSIKKNTRRISRQGLLSLLAIFISFNVNANTNLLSLEAREITNKVKYEEISLEKGKTRFFLLMKKVQIEVKIRIAKGDYAEADAILDHHLQVARQFNDTKTKLKIISLKKHLHRTIMSKVNKEGLFKHKKNIILIKTVHAENNITARLTANQEIEVNRRKVQGIQSRIEMIEEIKPRTWKYIAIIYVDSEHSKTYRDSLSTL